MPKKRHVKFVKKPLSAIQVLQNKHKSEKGLRHIKLVPLLCLEKFRAGTASAEDWCTIRIRLGVGVNLAQEKYTIETVQQLEACRKIVDVIKSRFLASDTFSATTVEFEYLRAGLVATDEMQDRADNAAVLAAYESAVAQIAADGT